jgi:hypothetical protein
LSQEEEVPPVVDPVPAAEASPGGLDNLKLGGSIRLRGESKEDYDFSGSSQDYFLSQFRINLWWDMGEKLSFFVEGQDSRIFGEETKPSRPTIFEDRFDAHQAYLDALVGENVKLRLGRQKLNLGDLRLVASLEWVNTARVWDGLRVTVGDAETRSADLFYTRLVPVHPTGFNDYASTGNRYFNSAFSGIFVTDKSIVEAADVQYWWLWRDSDDNQDSTHTFGGSYSRKVGEVEANLSASGQAGEFGGEDHNAWMLHAELGRDFDGIGHLSTAYNFATGDDDADEHGTFDNLYPLNHAYYGYMDLFSLQNIHNLEVVLKNTVFEKGKLRIGGQAFWLDEPNTDSWYNAGMAGNASRKAAAGTGTDSYVGSELDLTFRYPLPSESWIEFGASQFFAGDYVEQTGNSEEDPTFLYLMFRKGF